MTRQEIFVQILSEVSGRPKKDIETIFINFRATQPGGKWDEIISDQKAKIMLDEMREEAPGILQWLEKASKEVEHHESSTIH